MINKLHIRNFAIIDELTLDFKPGLTVITGETGSGKSIILQALGVTMGSKPTKTMIKSGQDRATIETSHGKIEYYRVIPEKGRIKNYIDDIPVSEKEYKVRTRNITDFHGQHEQQLIMDSSTHIHYLDNYAGLEMAVNELNILYNDLDIISRKLEKVKTNKVLADERKELLSFQLNEIESVNPKPDEDTRLHEEFTIGSHQEEIITTISELNSRLESGGSSIQGILNDSIHDLDRLLKWDPGLKDFVKLLNEAVINLQEVNAGLNQHITAINFDRDRLRELEDRLQALDSLKRKYGGSLDQVIERKDSIVEELADLKSLDKQIALLEKALVDKQNHFRKSADSIHGSRQAVIDELSTNIMSEMRRLQMPGAKFKIELSQIIDKKSFVSYDGQPVKYSADGYDFVQFLLSANPGEKLKPLTEIASGGEVSRIMLAIKTILQNGDPVDTLIFDEIDSGISGTAAEKVAESLVNLARNKQVICITHLPQIAVRSHNHLQVNKNISHDITTVSARYLNNEEVIRALAQLTAGNKYVAEDLSAARAMYERYHG